MLPQVFITAETDPAESPPMSRVIAQETPTVSSREKSAAQENHTHVMEFVVRLAGTMHKPAARNPTAPTMRRAIFRSPDFLAQRSEIHPPRMSPTVPASKSRLA